MEVKSPSHSPVFLWCLFYGLLVQWKCFTFFSWKSVELNNFLSGMRQTKMPGRQPKNGMNGFRKLPIWRLTCRCQLTYVQTCRQRRQQTAGSPTMREPLRTLMTAAGRPPSRSLMQSRACVLCALIWRKAAAKSISHSTICQIRFMKSIKRKVFKVIK